MGQMRQVSDKLIVSSCPPQSYSSTSLVTADGPVFQATSVEKSRTSGRATSSSGCKLVNLRLVNNKCEIVNVSCQELITLDQGSNNSGNELNTSNEESNKLGKESKNSGAGSNIFSRSRESNTSGRGSSTFGSGSSTFVNGSNDIGPEPTTSGYHKPRSPIEMPSQEHHGLLLKPCPVHSALRTTSLQPEVVNASSSGSWSNPETEVEARGTFYDSAEWKGSCRKPETGEPDRKSPIFRKAETEEYACSANMAFVSDEDKII